MTWLKETFWPWWKKYWKWVIFPVGILGFILALISGTKIIDEVTPNIENLVESDEERDRRIEEANEKRDQALVELAEKNKERLEHISEEQEKELQELANKPIEEVVAWFDQF